MLVSLAEAIRAPQKSADFSGTPLAIRREVKGNVLTTPPRPSTSDFPKCEVTWQVDGQGCVDRRLDPRETH